jgi:hypothetical protein
LALLAFTNQVSSSALELQIQATEELQRLGSEDLVLKGVVTRGAMDCWQSGAHVH